MTDKTFKDYAEKSCIEIIGEVDKKVVEEAIRKGKDTVDKHIHENAEGGKEEGTSAKNSMLVDAGIKSRSILTERKNTDAFYMCKFCNKKFDDKDKADKHMKICAKKAENA